MGAMWRGRVAGSAGSAAAQGYYGQQYEEMATAHHARSWGLGISRGPRPRRRGPLQFFKASVITPMTAVSGVITKRVKMNPNTGTNLSLCWVHADGTSWPPSVTTLVTCCPPSFRDWPALAILNTADS